MSNSSAIKLVVCDVDGVLTDGRQWQNSDGELKRVFSIRDSLGLRALKKQGVAVVVITASATEDVRTHVQSIGVDECYFDCDDKATVLHDVIQRMGLVESQVAFIGAETRDLPLIKRMGFSATVSSAPPAMREAVAFIALRSGGDGAVAEICQTIAFNLQQLDRQRVVRPRTASL